MFKTNTAKSLILITALAATAGCDKDKHNHPDSFDGKQLFNYHCETCHGSDGTGLLFYSTPANILTTLNKQEIARYITNNSHHDEREMPIFSHMPKSEAQKIAQHLLTLKEVYKKQSVKHKKPQGMLISP